MNLDFLTREVWDAIIVGAMLLALALAAVRLYADFSRREYTPHPPAPEHATRPSSGEGDYNDDMP